jgi:probable rRNA maturation factor
LSKPTYHFVIEDPRWKSLLRGQRQAIKSAINTVFQLESLPASSLSLVCMNDASLREYNHRYRQKDKPTNILSFTSAEAGYAGDLLLAYETILREAAEQQKPPEAHLLHLVVHGTLHLLGYDHEQPAAAEVMENKEISILKAFGIANPYQ